MILPSTLQTSIWFPLNFKGPQNISVPTLIILCDSSQKKELPLLSYTNTASRVLDSSLCFSVSPNVSLSRLLSIYKRNTHVSQWKRIRDGENRVSSCYLFQPPFNAKVVESGLLFPTIPPTPLWNGFPDGYLALHRVTSNCLPFSLSPLDIGPWMNPLWHSLPTGCSCHHAQGHKLKGPWAESDPKTWLAWPLLCVFMEWVANIYSSRPLTLKSRFLASLGKL